MATRIDHAVSAQDLPAAPENVSDLAPLPKMSQMVQRVASNAAMLGRAVVDLAPLRVSSGVLLDAVSEQAQEALLPSRKGRKAAAAGGVKRCSIQ